MRIRVPGGRWVALLILFAIALCYDAGPRSIAPVCTTVLREELGTVEALAFRPRGSLIVAARDHIWRLMNVGPDGRGVARGPVVNGNRIALSPDGSLLAAESAGTVTLWDVTANALRVQIAIQAGAVSALAFSRDGATLAVAGDESISIRETATGHERVAPIPKRPGVISLALSPDGGVLATGEQDGYIRIWDVPQRLERSAVRAYDARVRWVAFSCDGRTLVSVPQWGSVPQILDVATCSHIASLRDHPTPVQTAVFSPDGRMLATAAVDGPLWLWNAKTGRPLAVLQGNDACAFTIGFSPDGHSLAAGGVGQTIWRWDLTSLDIVTHP